MRATDIDPANYEQQLTQKIQDIRSSFAAFTMPELQSFSSPALHYRMRAEFRVWHQEDDLYHIMFDQDTKQKYRVDHFPPASELINAMMSELMQHLKHNQLLRRKLFQIDYLSTLSNEIVVTLVYHKPLDEEWQQEINKLLKLLREQYKVDIIGRSRKQKLIMDRDFVLESLPINDRSYTFKQIENSFTQPNAAVNCKMIEWALDVSRDSQGDLLELYCGLGNFTLPLAQNFDKVIATEISKPSVAAAQFNIQANNIDNVTILRMSSEEFTQAVKGEKTFKRLEGLDLSTYDCQTVLVDPPRAGLDDETLSMIQQYQNIIYISCNPETLKQNLEVLTQTHKVERFALFDQFPYTHHAESGVYLKKKD